MMRWSKWKPALGQSGDWAVPVERRYRRRRNGNLLTEERLRTYDTEGEAGRKRAATDEAIWRAGLPPIPAPRADAGSDGLEVR